MNLGQLPEHLKLVNTADGSPSMQISYAHASEWMHSSQGAFRESIYIYSTALAKANQLNLPLKILSVGLGLGYNEIISAGFAISNNRPIHLEFYENEPFLIDSFIQWTQGKLSQSSALYGTYEKILQYTCSEFTLPSENLRKFIHDLGHADHLINLGSLSRQAPMPKDFSLVYFDPFSSRASPEFWTPEFIELFLQSTCGRDCVVSTYAATGHLKRALQQMAFDVDLRPGFAGKRNATVGVRLLSRIKF